MKEFEISKLPISVGLVNAFEYIICAVLGRVVFLNQGTSTISTVASHACPEKFDEARQYRSYTCQKGVKMSAACGHPACGESLLVTTNKANVAVESTFKAIDECMEDFLSLWV